jgi:zinc protease
MTALGIRARKTILSLLLAMALPLAGVAQAAVGAAQAASTGLARFTLDNGLEVFVLENHTVPLARIQITFRTGAISQGPQTAGLFHLYEHMLFKGNAAHRTQTDLQAAMKDLGVANWNGGTSGENVSYYFTVPSEKTAQGIQFWADAVRTPLLDPKELETEKDVVVNEILGYLSDPDNVYGSALDKALFSKYPWRKDVSGSEALVRAATVPVLQSIRDTWYVPNNAALFVGGDVSTADVRAAVQKSFGDWKKARDPWSPPPPAHPVPPSNVLLVYPDEAMYQGVFSVDLEYRGPDVTVDPAATYAADVLGGLIEDPNGRFKADIFAAVPGLYKKEYQAAAYATLRDGGYIYYSTYGLVSPGQDTFARLAKLRAAYETEMKSIATDSAYFTQTDFDVLKRRLGDQVLLERETVNGFINALSFWWSSASTDYYLGYYDALARVTRPDIARFITTYISAKPGVLAVRMNPADFAKEKAAAEKAGWTVISPDNAYWWKTASGGTK